MRLDLTGPLVRRFPLVPRQRPACGPLPARVDHLCARARAAARDGDTVAASAVYNLTALLASDCGRPDLARQWCRQHAALRMRSHPLTGQDARQALEPVVNLARLRIRDGDGLVGYRLLDTLHNAVASRTDTTIDGIEVPAANLTATQADHRELRRWLWSVHLAEGTRALASIGRWQAAHQHLRAHNGIGQRMLDGRQVAIIARATTGDEHSALNMLASTTPGEPWQDAVTACLAALCAPSSRRRTAARTTMLQQYQHMQATQPPAVFHTRLGLSVIDVLADAEHPAVRDIATTLIQRAVVRQDAHTARDLLGHDICADACTPRQTDLITASLHASGLGGDEIPEPLLAQLTAALDKSAAVLTERGAIDTGHRRPETAPVR